MAKSADVRVRCSERWKAELRRFCEEVDLDMADVVREAVTQHLRRERARIRRRAERDGKRACDQLVTSDQPGGGSVSCDQLVTSKEAGETLADAMDSVFRDGWTELTE